MTGEHVVRSVADGEGGLWTIDPKGQNLLFPINSNVSGLVYEGDHDELFVLSV